VPPAPTGPASAPAAVTAAATARRVGLPRAFRTWVAAESVSAFGDSALFFALGWAATGLGPRWAGLVLTAMTAPRAVLLIAGGTVGDRVGARRVLLTGNTALTAVAVVLAVAAHTAGPRGVLLVGTGLIVGAVEAFTMPAAGTMARRYFTDPDLPRALAVQNSLAQTVRLLGGPIAGVLVVTIGLAGTAAVDAVTFTGLLAVLTVTGPPHPDPLPPRRSSGASVGAVVGGVASGVAAAVDGIRVTVTDPLLRAVLTATALVAAFVLPLTSLCVPLLTRAHHWPASTAGLLLAATAAGMVGLAAAPTPTAGIAAAVVEGAGVGLFGAHIGPLFFTTVPRSHLTRAQSLLLLAQTLPLLVTTNAVAALAAHTTPAAATLLGQVLGRGVRPLPRDPLCVVRR